MSKLPNTMHRWHDIYSHTQVSMTLIILLSSLFAMGMSTPSYAYSSVDTMTITPQYRSQTNIAEPNLATIVQQDGSLNSINRCNLLTFNETIYSVEAIGGIAILSTSPNPIEYIGNIIEVGSCDWGSCSDGYSWTPYTIRNPWLSEPDYYNLECARVPGTITWQ